MRTHHAQERNTLWHTQNSALQAHHAQYLSQQTDMQQAQQAEADRLLQAQRLQYEQLNQQIQLCSRMLDWHEDEEEQQQLRQEVQQQRQQEQQSEQQEGAQDQEQQAQQQPQQDEGAQDQEQQAPQQQAPTYTGAAGSAGPATGAATTQTLSLPRLPLPGHWVGPAPPPGLPSTSPAPAA